MKEEIEQRLHQNEMSLASFKKRGVAFFIDELLLSLLLIIAIGDSFFEAKNVEEMIVLTNTFVLEYMAMKVVYQAFFVVQYGATLGKIAMKIRVVEKAQRAMQLLLPLVYPLPRKMSLPRVVMNRSLLIGVLTQNQTLQDTMSIKKEPCLPMKM